MFAWLYILLECQRKGEQIRKLLERVLREGGKGLEERGKRWKSRERVGKEGKGLEEGGTALEVYKEKNSVQPCHS